MIFSSIEVTKKYHKDVGSFEEERQILGKFEAGTLKAYSQIVPFGPRG